MGRIAGGQKRRKKRRVVEMINDEVADLASNLDHVHGGKRVPPSLKRLRDAKARSSGRPSKAQKAKEADSAASASSRNGKQNSGNEHKHPNTSLSTQKGAVEADKITLATVKAHWTAEHDYKALRGRLRALLSSASDHEAAQIHELGIRVALECGELAHVKHALKEWQSLAADSACAPEFYAYCVLSALIADEPSEVASLIREMGPEKLQSEPVQHALAVVRAVQKGDCAAFQCLTESAPFMSVYLLDALLDRVRLQALQPLSKKGKSIDLAKAQALLKAASKEECAEILAELGLKVGAN